ncbi:DUF7502 family protein [Methanolobus profundi]|uniref:Uncharacterized protein n=1 Tax=Methanolobus profundi TaxID=487685 RepID=A0A1I4P9A6_9EURY|nr:hypothetical protein [Methanolobus profundi]SFM24361.1 hypothetical protein SAMN04488696_0521 [Methanolobus profundi]
MDVRDFVKKQEAALKRYRRIYKLLDLVGTAIILYLLLFYIGVDQIFQYLSNFEVKAGTSYDILGMNIAFETVALTLIASFVSIIITFLRHLRDDRKRALFLIEEKYPELHEKLRTAYDNATTENLIVSDLLDSVSLKVKQVASSALLVKGKVIFGLIIILVSSATLVYVVDNDVRTTGFTPDDLADVINDLAGNDNENPDDFVVLDDEENEAGNTGTENLTGETAIIVVEGTEVDLTLPAGSGIGFSNQEDAEEEDTDFERSSAYEISIISSQSYYEELPEGYESVIKSYFEEMANN